MKRVAFFQWIRLFFLPLTPAFCGATNRRKTSYLVVSLLTNCKNNRERGRRPAWQGRLLSRKECCHATPHPPREVKTKLFSPPFYFWLLPQPCRCFKMKRGPLAGPIPATSPLPPIGFGGPLASRLRSVKMTV